MSDLAATRAGRPGRPLLPGVRLRIGVAMVALLAIAGLVSLVWTPFPIGRSVPAEQLLPPGPAHWLGTDQAGRDLLSLLMASLRSSLVLATFATLIGLLVGAPLGVLAATYRGWIDQAVDALGSFVVVFSALVIAMALTALNGPGSVNALIAIAVVNALVAARAIRTGIRAFDDIDYVSAARLSGLSGWTAAQRHLLPHFVPFIILLALQQIAFGILVESGLTYVGLGTTAAGGSLGLMLKEAQGFLQLDPLLALFPGLAIVLLVVALRLTEAGLRETLDPRLRTAGDDDGLA